MQFSGKNILLTGGTGGIGAQLKNQIIANGGNLSIISRNGETFKGANTIKGDLSTPEGIEDVCKQIAPYDWDMVINLAGTQYFGLFEKQNAESLYQNYMINLIAPSRIIATILPKMKSNNNGHIVNIGSIFGSINFAHFVTYSSSKAGLKALSQALRRELHGTNIKTTYIAPRAVKTKMNSELVMKLADATNMKMDAPSIVVARIIKAIIKEEKDVYIGFPEALFVRINGLFPSFIDNALAPNDEKARELLI